MARCRAYVAWVLPLVLVVAEWNVSLSFTPLQATASVGVRHGCLPLHQSSPQSETEPSSPVSARVIQVKRSKRGGGGRVRRTADKDTKPKPQQKQPAPSPKRFWILAPLLLVAILSSLLFGGDDVDTYPSSSSFYYYQSSYYESSLYRGDGQYDTSRKESIRTNIPSVYIERELNEPQQTGKGSSNTYYFMEPSQQDRQQQKQSFDQELEDDVESMMRLRKNIYDEFFPEL